MATLVVTTTVLRTRRLAPAATVIAIAVVLVDVLASWSPTTSSTRWTSRMTTTAPSPTVTQAFHGVLRLLVRVTIIVVATSTGAFLNVLRSLILTFPFVIILLAPTLVLSLILLTMATRATLVLPPPPMTVIVVE
ncbi:uncharacterized protein ARMOST_04150 [Armillaria ostoyae]|uniref:Uncharacterized protein n=1 Tax=Armillaria ostoyae TaxID=47428 RepID=A0A284QWI4_ARMOS|nr:uncharacterized protein ARMOST_04150 [Armillaria ostoyae]